MPVHDRFGLGPGDVAVIVGYVAATVIIGAWSRRKTETREGYFLGGRRFGWLVQSFAYFGQAAAADGPVGVATATFHNGVAGIWASLLMVFCTPLFWITSPWLRRLRILTMGDFYGERYGSRRMAATYALIATVGMMSLLSAGYIAIAKTAVAIMAPPPSAATLSPDAVIWAAFVITLFNAVLGGLAAAFYTAVLQGCLVVLLSVILLPFGLARINALDGGHGAWAALHSLHARLPGTFFQVFGSPNLPDFPWYYVLAISLVAGITVVTQPNQLVTNAAARNEASARVGMITGTFIKRLCTILWALGALVAVALYGSALADSDLVWGFATRDLLGPAGCGLVGLMLVGLLSAVMAVSSSLMLTMSGLITNNLYRPLRPGKSDRHYIAFGRMAGAVYLAGAALMATQFGTLLAALRFNWEFFSIFAGAFWLGLKWRRANRAGAWASILVTAGIFYLLPVALTGLFPNLRTSPALLLQAAPRPVAHLGPGAFPGPASVRPPSPVPAIFWSQGGRRDESGRLHGRGYLYLDLLLLQTAGFDLRTNPPPLNETIRIAIRLLSSFLVLALVAQITPPDDPATSARFFAKMRTRVPGAGEAEVVPGATQLAEPPADSPPIPRIFPESNWEIYRWSRQDAYGFALSVGVVLAVLGLLWGAVSLGG
jgi:Na+/proline symporter